MNKIKTLCIGISLCSISLNAQTWNNSTVSTITNGNVGIGTTGTPSDKLQIKAGNIRINENQSLRWDDASGLINGSIGLSKGTNYSLNLKSDKGSVDLFSNTYFSVNTFSNGSYLNRFQILNDGKVGIGTSAPSTSLEIKDQNAQITLQSTGKVSGPYTVYLPGINFKTNNRNFFVGTEFSPTYGEYLKLKDLNDANSTAILLRNGKVIISPGTGVDPGVSGYEVGLGQTWIKNLAIGGKFASDSKLSVAGKATFEEAEVKLSSLWPDYVFANDYQLASLDSVENFIQKNSHLPNVPSAQEVSEKGINLGNMDAVLLQKIEELTLYNIQMHKQMEAMKAEITALKQN
jgi:hypothetical protein